MRQEAILQWAIPLLAAAFVIFLQRHIQATPQELGEAFEPLPRGNDGYIEAMGRFCKIFDGYTNATACTASPTAAQIIQEAEDFVMGEARKKAKSFELPSGWFSNVRDRKWKQREKCRKNRYAIFIGGGSGGGKDSMKQFWMPLLEKNNNKQECGFVYVDYNQLVVGAGQEEGSILRQAWKQAKAREGFCAQARYGFKGGFLQLVNALVTRAIADGLNIVLVSTMSRATPLVDGWFNQIDTRVDPYRHRTFIFGATQPMHLAAIKLWNRVVGRTENSGQNEDPGVEFVPLCKIYESHVWFARAFEETFSMKPNVSLYDTTDFTQKPIIIYQTNHVVAAKDLGHEARKRFQEFLKVARTPAYIFEKNIKLYDEARNILREYKFMNYDCGFCNCDIVHFYRSEKGPTTELNYRGDWVSHSSEILCYDQEFSDGCWYWSQCTYEWGRRRCPLMCGMCYWTDVRFDKCGGIKRRWDTGHGILSDAVSGFKWAANWLTGGAAVVQTETTPRPKQSTDPIPMAQKVDPYVSKKYLSVEETGIGHIMISYKNGMNEGAVHDLHCKLEYEGYKVWLDRHDIGDRGGNYIDAMASAIQDSAIILVGMSQPYMESEWCQHELQYACVLRKELIPLQVQSLDFVPRDTFGFILGTKIMFDLTGPTMQDDAWQALHKEIKKRLAQRGLKLKMDSDVKKGWMGGVSGLKCLGNRDQTTG